MKITTVRFRRLESHKHGYGHDAIEAEASVEDGETADEALSALQAWVLARLKQEAEISNHIWSLERLQDNVSSYERTLAGLKKDVERGRKVISDHEKLADLAREHGLDAQASQLGDGVPF
ncbi:hypothetical protein ACFB49_42890 [Sphingomonas sp. DBB INV C78]|uniref:hypothetical protein n=1 Tax=Sphingomonas sp. DBB INV C78 TaxID=3349434 RepID=UPI0036D36648